jgi:hypothetical protein
LELVKETDWLTFCKQLENKSAMMTHWLPNSLATKRKPDLRMQRLDATGTVVKILDF